MAHQRKLIRQAVVGFLLNQTSAGARVEATRLLPWHRNEFPALSVYTLEESSVVENNGPRSYRRKVDLVIEGCLQATATIDDQLDDLALQIETVMSKNLTISDLVNDSQLVSTDIEIVENGKTGIAAVKVTYEVTYFSDDSDLADLTLADFSTADVKYNLADAQLDADQAHDTLTDLED